MLLIVNGEEKLLNDNDTHVVFVRPKAFIDSSGTTWANETMHLRTIHPDVFEVQTDQPIYSTAFRSVCSKIHDSVKYYKLMTVQGDWSRCEPGIIHN